MKKLACTALAFAVVTTIASAQTPQPIPPAMHGGQSAQILSSLPGEALTVTHWYKQNVYEANMARNRSGFQPRQCLLYSN